MEAGAGLTTTTRTTRALTKSASVDGSRRVKPRGDRVGRQIDGAHHILINNRTELNHPVMCRGALTHREEEKDDNGVDEGMD